MFGLGVPELVIILVIILVIFGGSQLPKLARSIGTSAKELRKGLKDDDTKETSKKTAVKSGKKDA
jgi:sec-independent protein translocase protein TatA